MNPERLVRLFIEVIFLLLGGLVMWLGWTNHIFFDRHKPAWLILSIALVLWGARAIYKPAKSWARGESWTRGTSLVLLGLVMLAIARAPFSRVGFLLAAAGAILVLRGIVGFVLVLRSR